MHIYREFFAVFTLWLALVAVVGVFVVRITTLLYRQRQAEVAYRMQLAVSMGTAVREAESETGGRR